MPQCIAFDLYDERWRDCWLAATSAARLRKKQTDVDIQQRVARLLEDYGPSSEKPLTLRVYGTMLKGFCVINNERARSLSCDCERVVFPFARKPFAEGDNTIRLPAAKRPRMEAALTLDLDLARVEASEAFDWTQAPLEEGALLRLTGAQMPTGEAMIPPSLDFAGAGFAADAAGLGAPAEAGWLPRLPGEAAFVEMAADVEAVQDPLLLSQLVLPDGFPQVLGAEFGMPADGLPAEAPVNPDATAPPSAMALAVQQRRRSLLGKPGVVYGFDNETMLTPEQYSLWQQSSSELNGGRTRPAGYAAMMASAPEKVERCGPRLRYLLDPADGSSSWQVPAMDFMDGHAPEGGLPDVQALLSAAGEEVPMGFPYGQAQEMGGQFNAPWDAELQQLGLCQEGGDGEDGTGAGGAEAQDERTAQVGAILRGCLKRGDTGGVFFEDLVPPGAADVQTAACTFSALLALASAGEFSVSQGEPYGRILVSEVPVH